MVRQLYNADDMDALLAESEMMAQKRAETSEMLEAFTKANQVISEIRGFCFKKLIIFKIRYTIYFFLLHFYRNAYLVAITGTGRCMCAKYSQKFSEFPFFILTILSDILSV